jgi:flagellar basal-body rod protein FlgB
MISPVSISDTYQMARKLLDASVVRQEAIASNIANADTPGYRRVDLAPDFATQLRGQLEAGKYAEADAMKPKLVEDLTARSVRPDGNTIELERELLEMNRNSIEYNYLSEIVSHDIKQLKLAINGSGSL